MAFFSKVGSILKQSVSKQITSQLSANNSSIYQAIRCMSSKVFVGGLPYAVDESTLEQTFSQYGQVVDARVIVDRETGRSRGFGFITYASSEEANSAIQALDGQDLHGRRVRVNLAAERPPRQYGGGYGGGGGGGYGGSGGSYGGGGGSYGGENYGRGAYGGQGGSYGGGGGSYGGQNYGGGAPGGQYSGGNYGSGGGNDGYGSGGGNYGVAGGNDSFFGGGSTTNVTAEAGFASRGFEKGSGLGYDDNNQFGINASGSAANDNAVDYDPSEAGEGNFRDEDEKDDFAKRA